MSKNREGVEVKDIEDRGAVNAVQSHGLSVFSFLRLFGSLTFGIVVMVILVGLLAWGTLIESSYGRRVAMFAIYGSRWFVLLLAIFGLNILCSVLCRVPYRREHLPFLFSHGGILILLAGAAMTWLWGEEAQITIPEGIASEYAVKTDSQQFTIESIPISSASGKRVTSLVDFEPGPFNWDEYRSDNKLSRDVQNYRDTLWIALQLGHRDTGKLSLPDNLGGVNVEVLDFYASAAMRRVSPMKLNLLWKQIRREETELGEVRELARNWETVELSVPEPNNFMPIELRGSHVEMFGGERVCFHVTTSTAELEAFKIAKPNKSTSFGNWGQLILFIDGRNHFIDVDKLVGETEGGKSYRISGTDFNIADVNFVGRGLLLRFALVAASGERRTIFVNAEKPEINVHAAAFGVFASYWVDPVLLKEHRSEYVPDATINQMSLPRIEFMQAPDKQIYYKFWNGRDVVEVGVVPDPLKMNPPGSKPAFTLGAGSEQEVEVRLDWYEPHDLPGVRIVPQKVGRMVTGTQWVLLQVTVDGIVDKFWLRAVAPMLGPSKPESDQIRYVCGKGRTVSIEWNYVNVELGFGIFLKRFEKRTEPGTRMASHYSSLVDFVNIKKRDGKSQGITQSQNEFTTLKENVTIAMNQPAVFKGNGGKRYRIYQSEFSGPFHPGDYRFHELYDGKIFDWETMPRESIYMSTLSINSDPGRGLKYLGSFMLLFGIAWFFYGKRTAKK
ncbi:MAG: hypothetical protein LBQ66_04475 [Planctomycetaceae bacterium]|jgi:hypothetical protein|nr:hypothetical protein [Planctomycetaceae bacterium]